MIFTAPLFGLIVGWFICWLSDRLPTLSASKNLAFAAGGGTVSGSFGLKKQTSNLTLLSFGVMLFTAVLFTYLWHLLSYSGHFFFLAGLCAFLILIAVIDLKYQLILNVLIVPAIFGMLLYQFVPVTQSSWSALLGGIVIFLLFMLVGLLARGGLGGGDIKLATFLGVTFGLPYVFWALVAGGLAGGGTAVFLLLVRRWQPKTHIPYGPFLCFGALVALLVNPLPWLLALFA